MRISLINRARLFYLGQDVLVGSLIPLALVSSLQPADVTYALLVFYLLGLVRTIGNLAVVGSLFGSIERWLDNAPAHPEPRELRAIDERIRRGPARLLASTLAGWLFQLVGGSLVLLYIDPYRANVPPYSLVVVTLTIGAVVLGGIPLLIPLISSLFRESARRLFALCHGPAIAMQRPRTSLQLKLILMMGSACLAGPLYLSGNIFSLDARRQSTEIRMHGMLAASELARRLAPLDPADTAALTRLAQQASTGGVRASIASRDGTALAGDRTSSPRVAAWLAQPAPPEAIDVTASARDSEVAVRAVAANGLVAVVMCALPPWGSGSSVLAIAVFLVAVFSWAPICAYFLSVDVVRPLEEISRAVQQITDTGKLDQVAEIPVTGNDETGLLALRFNELIDTLRDLSAAARALARGDLEVKLEGEGDVAIAFRTMIGSLAGIVRQIHEASVLLAAAAAQIYAASQEQEAAAASQSTAMTEIRQTMESLFEAAAHTSESIRGVLSNAERTLETTDRMVVRIGELTSHAGRIGEILETIRDISDRSDLLALNGALEASRAGESGRGFGLVAGEMRRLAERVVTSVHDVRALVGDIRASGSSTMMATEDSKKLASNTTDAARQITLVSQQQRSGTEQVLQSVREIAETLTQSVAAMTQTRASAEQLKGQADKLSGLVRTFRIKAS